MIPAKYSSPLLSVMRIWVGFTFLPHGAQKLFGVLGRDAVPLVSQAGLAGVIELVGGALLILGLWTRPVAFLCSGMMAVAYWQVHGLREAQPLPIQNGGELATVYCFVFLYLAAAGGGPWALERLLGKKS